MVRTNKPRVELSTIHRIVCSFYSVRRAYIFKKSRDRNVVQKRQIFHYLARVVNNDKISLNVIGRYYSNVTGNSWDHATVLHSFKEVAGLMKIYPQFKEEILELEDLCIESNILDQENIEVERLKLLRIVVNANNLTTMRKKLNQEFALMELVS